MRRLALAEKWNAFFFTPTDPRALGLFRIGYGLIVFVMVLGVFPHRAHFYGVNAIVTPETMDRFLKAYWTLFPIRLPVAEPGLEYFLLALMASALCLSAGIGSRFASLAVFVGLQALNNRNPFMMNAGDLLMRIDATLLIFADCGAALSVDRWWRLRTGRESGPPRRVSAWPQRVLQLQLSYLYLSAGILKLKGETWRNGTALYYALRYLELRRFSFRYLFYYLWQIRLATWGTVAAELAMGTLVWVPRLRCACLVAACALHLGINLALQFPVFQYVMLVNLLLFV